MYADTLPALQHDFKLEKKEQWRWKQDSAKEDMALFEGNVLGDAGRETSEKMELVAAGKHAQGAKTSAVEKRAKDEQPAQQGHALAGEEASAEQPPVTTIAWADSFDSQGSYLLASAFDRVYLQPTGGVPLSGVSMQIPFFKRALEWLGIKVYAEARREFKSMVSTFTQADGLPPAQIEDESRLLGELGRSLAYAIGINRYSDMDPDEAADKVAQLSKEGPFSAQEALEAGLISGVKYKREAIKELGEDPKIRSMASYARITDKLLDRRLHDDERANVAVIYLRGTISNSPGDFSASSAIKGLKEAGEDPDVSSIVLRIDSGGGDAIASDSIWDAVKRVQEENNKPVVASFGNASASGGYYAAAGADAILACESTITGSIGVASLRPTFTLQFFERIGVRLQTLLTGSKMMSSLHELEPEEKEKSARHIDAMYEGFLDKVCSGRNISRDVVEDLAGGRVWTGLAAWIRCNADKELVRAESPAKAGQSEGGEGDDESRSVVPAKNLAKDWQTVDVTRENEMSTLRIRPISTDVALGHAAGGDASTSGRKEEDDDGSASELVDAFVNHVAAEEEGHSAPTDAAKTQGAARADAADEESQLAMKAHEEAEASHLQSHTTNEQGEERKSEGGDEVELGPYGRGLVDAIGGLYDAGYLAMSMGIQREMDALIKEGMTLEQASASVRPGCQREWGPEGTMSLATDLRLVRYPKEKSFRERVRELNRKGDQPTLSLFLPGLGSLLHQVKTCLSDVAVQILVHSWNDPAFLQRVVQAMEREQAFKMEHSHSIRY